VKQDTRIETSTLKSISTKSSSLKTLLGLLRKKWGWQRMIYC